ncbi:MAG: hypothetical protein IJ221_07380 [Oscillibacter sp.]|nr:hypothetical protein [Oscillibacter sp.]
MKKERILSLFFAAMLVASLCLPASASERDDPSWPPPFVTETGEIVPMEGQFYAGVIGSDITPQGQVQTVSVNLPKDGAWHKIYPEFGIFELTKGYLTISGTWKPAYGTVEFKLTSASGSSTSGTGISSCGSVIYPVIRNTTYTVYAKAISTTVAGMVQITSHDTL